MIMSLKRIITIFKKQKRELFRNPKMLLIFAMFPAVLLIITFVEKDSSLYLFLIMGCVLPPMTCIASEIGEEREKGTLRGLVFAGLKSYEYLIGMMLCDGLFSILCVAAMGMILEGVLGIEVAGSVIVLSIVTIGCSMVIGAIIGVSSKNQVTVSAVTVPVSLFMLFSSIFGMANKSVHSVTQYLYSQAYLDMLVKNQCQWREIGIILLNILLVCIVFSVLYLKRKRED